MTARSLPSEYVILLLFYGTSVFIAGILFLSIPAISERRWLPSIFYTNRALRLVYPVLWVLRILLWPVSLIGLVYCSRPAVAVRSCCGPNGCPAVDMAVATQGTSCCIEHFADDANPDSQDDMDMRRLLDVPPAYEP